MAAPDFIDIVSEGLIKELDESGVFNMKDRQESAELLMAIFSTAMAKAAVREPLLLALMEKDLDS